MDDTAHFGIQVDREQDFHVRNCACDLNQSMTKLCHSRLPVLATVISDQYPDLIPTETFLRSGIRKRPQQRVYARVSNDVNLPTLNAFFEQVRSGELCWTEMNSRSESDDPSIKFLRKGVHEIAAPQSSFDMGNWQLFRESADCSHHGRGCVTLDDEHVRAQVVEDFGKVPGCRAN